MQPTTYLALRGGPPHSASLVQRAASWVVRARLVSAWSHGGVAVDGVLMHTTSDRGLHRLLPGEWEPTRWALLPCHETSSSRVLELFEQHQGAAYDWLSLLAFAGLKARDSDRWYCFEWCWLALTGSAPTGRVTPEMLLHRLLSARLERDASSSPENRAALTAGA